MLLSKNNTTWLDRPIHILNKRISIETFVFSTIILWAIISRLVGLGIRPLSHDESIHIYFSYLFASGEGYFHTPLSHGPLQFHLIALLFVLFGTSDFIGRLPHAIASVVTIFLLYNWRGYLGRFGTIISAIITLVSPFFLFYGRYARNESFVILVGLITLYSILRYLETGKNRYLYGLTVATVLHFTIKETAFIYTAQSLVFLGIHFIYKTSAQSWRNTRIYKWFIILLIAGVLFSTSAIGMILFSQRTIDIDPIVSSETIIEDQAQDTSKNLASSNDDLNSLVVIGLFIIGGTAVFGSAILLLLGIGWRHLRKDRAISMMILLGTFVLPQLTAFPATWLGLDPLDYIFIWPGWDFGAIFVQPPVKTALILLILTTLSLAVGIAWDKKRWFTHAILFWGIYVIFYTSVFSNPGGFLTGTVGSLGYWLEQQAVHRGNQPWYYYLVLQMPVYEFLPFMGFILSIIVKTRNILRIDPNKYIQRRTTEPEINTAPFFSLLTWWGLSSFLAFSLAGEKMPWLTVHIVLPLILLSGWGLGQIIENTNWLKIMKNRAVLLALLVSIFIISSSSMLINLLGMNSPIEGKNQEQLFSMDHIYFWALIAVACCSLVIFHTRNWKPLEIIRFITLIIFGFLTLLTSRIAFRAAFMNAGDATEFLVYAHGSSGIQHFLGHLETASQCTSGGYNDLTIAYDAGGETQGVSWPMKWYLRKFSNAIPYYSPDEKLLQADVIIADPQSYLMVDALTGGNYYRFDSLRMVWPNQDYFDLTWSQITDALSNYALRNAIFQILYDRNYSFYAILQGKSGFNLYDWNPGDRMRLYIHKDVALKVWEYNILQQNSLVQNP